MKHTMKHIDEPRLEKDLLYRYAYLSEFMGFSDADVAAIHGSAEYLAPLVPGLVDAVYDKLSQFDATWRHFVPLQHGYEGEAAESVDSLKMDDSVIEFRKKHLGRYLTKLVTAAYDEKMVGYLDMVGAMHTTARGSASIDVPLVQMNALMGFVADAFIATIAGLDINADTKLAATRAFSKLLWLQNDLINRHYAAEQSAV